MSTATADRYTIISSDCHAGANHATYREYLESSWHDEFDAWRGKYRNPFRDLQDDGRSRNWDNDRRISEQHTDGVVAEITFPNTVPPFFPTGTLIAPQPSERDFPRRLAGIRAHNRWLADFCAEYPERRAGIGQIFLNDIDEAVADVAWIAEHDLRGGALIPSIAPNSDLLPLFHPRYDPVWAACEEHDVVLTLHSGGTGMPDFGDSPAAGPMFVIETPFFSNRSMWHLIMGGVFERFPGLKAVFTEQGFGWVPDILRRLDGLHAQMSKTGRTGELGFSADAVLPEKPSFYFERNIWIGISFPGPNEMSQLDRVGDHKVMWGSDYPHVEGTYPYSREGIRYALHNRREESMRRILAGNAAEVYGFDLDALAPLAAEHGPTVAEIAEPLPEVPADATSPAFWGK